MNQMTDIQCRARRCVFVYLGLLLLDPSFYCFNPRFIGQIIKLSPVELVQNDILGALLLFYKE